MSAAAERASSQRGVETLHQHFDLDTTVYYVFYRTKIWHSRSLPRVGSGKSHSVEKDGLKFRTDLPKLLNMMMSIFEVCGCVDESTSQLQVGD